MSSWFLKIHFEYKSLVPYNLLSSWNTNYFLPKKWNIVLVFNLHFHHSPVRVSHKTQYFPKTWNLPLDLCFLEFSMCENKWFTFPEWGRKMGSKSLSTSLRLGGAHMYPDHLYKWYQSSTCLWLEGFRIYAC